MRDRGAKPTGELALVLDQIFNIYEFERACREILAKGPLDSGQQHMREVYREAVPGLKARADALMGSRSA